MDGMLSSLLGKKRGKNLDDAACGSGISSGALQVFSHGYIVYVTPIFLALGIFIVGIVRTGTVYCVWITVLSR